METTEFKDIVVTCLDCDVEFTWTAGEQQFFASRNFTQPKRCRACRAAKQLRPDNPSAPRWPR